MKKLAKALAATFVSLATMLAGPSCDLGGEPAFGDTDPAPTADQVFGVMSRLKPEGCLYNVHGKGCDRPGGYQHGPDARRIAAAIASTVDGTLTGTRVGDAALMATYTSFESGNLATATGDCRADGVCRAHGAFQLWFVPEEVAFDPARAASVWKSVAASSMKTCEKNVPDERMASVAGSCSYAKARQKVRQRAQAARDALATP
jgi:hypothetical protein